MDDFSFGDESRIIKYTKDCKEFDSLYYVASGRSTDPVKEKYSYIFSYDLDDVRMLIATDGRRINYTPFASDGNYVVIKQTKTELVLEKLSENRYVETLSFSKVIPKDSEVFHIKPFEPLGFSNYNYSLEYLLDYLHRLSNSEVVFKLNYLIDFVDTVRPDGKIRILCPKKDSSRAWRIEHTDQWGNLRHGTVFMPLNPFNELVDVKSPYVEGSGFKEYKFNGK